MHSPNASPMFAEGLSDLLEYTENRVRALTLHEVASGRFGSFADMQDVAGMHASLANVISNGRWSPVDLTGSLEPVFPTVDPDAKQHGLDQSEITCLMPAIR